LWGSGEWGYIDTEGSLKNRLGTATAQTNFDPPHFTPEFMSHFVIKALPFTTRIAPGARNVLAADQARAAKFLSGGARLFSLLA
jgi:hypothetical protein